MKKILIVDDNIQNLYMLEILLKTNGYEVESAGNGQEALKLASQAPPDLIISDILMPGMDGFSLCRIWKKEERLKNIPFIFYTATYTDQKDRDFSISIGVDRFLVKPMAPDDMLQVIKEFEQEDQVGTAADLSLLEKNEDIYYKEYSEVLIHKLEDKMLQLNQANKRLQSLYQASQELASLKPHGEMVHNILSAIVKTAGYQEVNYFFFDQRDNKLHLLDAVGFSQGTLTEFYEHLVFSIGDERGLVGWVAEKKLALNIPDVSKNPNWITLDTDIHSALFVPVVYNENLYGVLGIFSQELTAFTEEDEQNISALANSMAVTFENRKAEEKIHMLNSLLERRVSERTSQLEGSNRELESIAQSISHNLRAPLRALEGYSQILSREYKDLLGDEGRRFLEIIATNARKMDQIINNMLEISRASVREITLKKLNIEKMIESIYAETALPEEQENIQFNFKPLDVSYGDENLIRQMWTSIISMAVKCAVSTTEPKIHIASRIEKGMVVYSINNNGQILDVDRLNRLFIMNHWEILDQSDDSCELELAIVQRIIKRHHGKIWAENCPDGGVCVTFTLPASSSKQ